MMSENYINSNCGFYVKFYWNTAVFVYILSMANICGLMAELSSCNRVYDQQRLKYLLSISVENTLAYRCFRLYSIMAGGRGEHSYGNFIQITATQLQVA